MSSVVLVDREVAAKIAFDAVKAALTDENSYSTLQVAAIVAANVRRVLAATTVAPAEEMLFETKLLGFGEGDRIWLCEPCLKRAMDDHLVSFSSALPAAAAAPRSNREPHPFQEHPHYPDYCAFAVGDEDYCKREAGNVIHLVLTATPTTKQRGQSR